MTVPLGTRSHWSINESKVIPSIGAKIWKLVIYPQFSAQCKLSFVFSSFIIQYPLQPIFCDPTVEREWLLNNVCARSEL